jgi:hypothetical protein
LKEEQAGAGNKDTLVQNVDFADNGLHALQKVQGKKTHPISLLMDTSAEEKSYLVLWQKKDSKILNGLYQLLTV